MGATYIREILVTIRGEEYQGNTEAATATQERLQHQICQLKKQVSGWEMDDEQRSMLCNRGIRDLRHCLLKQPSAYEMAV
jgi:hypothetical protein